MKENLYSQIIQAEDYNKIITEEHLYIKDSDNYVIDFLKKFSGKKLSPLEIVEFGCGPARLLKEVSSIEAINFTGVDIDRNFLAYAKKILSPKVKLVNITAEKYLHTSKIDIAYSQGFHHHVTKGNYTNSYLENIRIQLKPEGFYIISDEFIPEYNSEYDRQINLVIWYSHVIAHALNNSYLFLAREEAKTLLDDINEGNEIKNWKTDSQIELILENAKNLDNLSKTKIEQAKDLAKSLLSIINLRNHNINDDLTYSRRDFKICHTVFKKEIEKAGFSIKSFTDFGPVDTIGGMRVYILSPYLK